MKPLCPLRIVLLLALPLPTLALPSPPLEAQVPAGTEVVEALGSERIEALLAFVNAPGTLRLDGDAVVPAETALDGDVAVLSGRIVLAGGIRGDLAVLNGDVELLPGARVDGDVVVVGGVVTGPPETVGGRITLVEQPLRYTLDAGGAARLAARTEDAPDPGRLWGGSRFTVRNAGSYNRVEGLPVLFGPTLVTGGRNPLRIEALALWRTEGGFQLDEEHLGWLVRAEQRLGRDPRLTLGAAWYEEVVPIAEWGLSSAESSLATFLLHEDYRDHYERRGWRGFLRLEPERQPLALTLDLRDENHRFAAVSSPWSLRNNDDPWRPQPLVGEGDLTTVGAELILDTRNDPDQPTDGWLVTTRLRHGLDGDLRRPTLVPPALPGLPLDPAPLDSEFTSGFLDARRYARITPDADLSLRALAAGSVDGDPLPPQFQEALGGEGSLPGYPLFSQDCGARDARVSVDRTGYDDEEGAQPAFLRYGCDRVLLFQAEYRNRFSLDLGLGPEEGDEWGPAWDWYPLVDLSPSWVVFLNAGRGWSASEDELDTGWRSDLGGGLIFGDVGLYWAWPLEGEERSLNFFIRLNRRL